MRNSCIFSKFSCALLLVVLLLASTSESAERVTSGTFEGVKYHEEAIPVKVKKVYDGDTMLVEFFGKLEKVRFVGVDTPERDRKFYEEGTRFTKEFLKTKSVEIEICSAQRRDNYGRLLAWIYADGVH